MKKITALILALLMLASAAACAENKDNDTETQAGNESIVSETEPEETAIPDDLPEYNADGYKFRVLTHQKMIGIEEQDGEILNDTYYDRDRKVMERFNFTITVDQTSDYGQTGSKFKTSVTAASDDYDMAFLHMVNGASMAPSGYYYTINDIDYINLDKVWWDPQMNNGFSVGGKLFLAAGDILPETLLRTSCMAFNKNKFDDLNMTYPYDTAAQGLWTLDVLTELTKGQNQDLNGDGKIKELDDFFGLTQWYLDSPYSFYYGAGGTIVAKDENDIPYLDLNIDRNIAIYEKMYDLIVNNESNYHTDINTYTNAYDQFTQGIALFCECALTHLKGDKYREMENDYGILPIPKYDEKQEKYLGFVNGAASVMGIPKTIQDAECVGIIIEGLAAESYRMVTPKMYEVVAKTKHARDEESAAMVDIVIRERVFDFGYTHMFDQSLTNFHRDLLAKKSTNVASTFEKAEKSLTRALEKIITKYEENT